MHLLNPRPLPSIAILIAFPLLMACSQKSDEQTPLVDYPIVENQSTQFILAQSLRDNGLFNEADSVYQLLLLENYIRPLEKEYIQLNQLLCQFAANDTLYIETLVNASHLKGLGALVKGIHLTRKDCSGFEELYKAKQLLQQEGLMHSFYYFITLEQLGLAHRQKSIYMDSVTQYYKEAYNLFHSIKKSQKHTLRLLHKLAMHALVNRDELTGIGYVEEALAMLLDKEQQSLFLTTKATLLRKLKRMDESEMVWKKAHQLVIGIDSPYLKFNLYREKAWRCIDLSDSINLKEAISHLEKLRGLVPSVDAHIALLKGAFYYYSRVNVPDRYVPHYEQALKGFKGERIQNSAYIQQSLYVLTTGYLKLKNFQKAREFGYLSLVYTTDYAGLPYSFHHIMDSVILDDTYNFINYDLLANINIQQYYQDRNIKHIREAYLLYSVIDSLMAQKIHTHEDEATREFLGIGHSIYSRAIESCHLLNQHEPDARYVSKAHIYMERGKSLITHRAARRHDNRYFPEVPQSFKDEELKLKSELTALKRKNLSNQQQGLASVLQKLDDYYAKMKANYPAYYQAQNQPDIPDAASFSKESDQENKSLINLHLADNKVFTILYDGTPTLFAIDLPESFTDSLLNLRHTIEISNIHSLRRFKRNANHIYNMLVKPLGTLRFQLEIVPDGILCYLPFEVLLKDTVGLTFKSLAYLLTDHDISYRTGLKLENESRKKSEYNKILMYAFTSENKDLPSLKGATKEIKLLEENFSDARVTKRIGNDANKSNFLHDIKNEYDIIQVSMHAVSDQHDRLSNRIYFNSKKYIDEIDTLYGFEIISKQIKASLVILTSCDSGFGALTKGEGAISLARSFLHAGASTVVSSMWAVSDYSSPLICSFLYTNMNEGLLPSQSLNRAKRQYLATEDSNLASPFFWAGVVCFVD